eukprot:3850110-Pleurochrysis_carterae.AAC.2
MEHGRHTAPLAAISMCACPHFSTTGSTRREMQVSIASHSVAQTMLLPHTTANHVTQIGAQFNAAATRARSRCLSALPFQYASHEVVRSERSNSTTRRLSLATLKPCDA